MGPKNRDVVEASSSALILAPGARHITESDNANRDVIFGCVP